MSLIYNCSFICLVLKYSKLIAKDLFLSSYQEHSDREKVDSDTMDPKASVWLSVAPGSTSPFSNDREGLKL